VAPCTVVTTLLLLTLLLYLELDFCRLSVAARLVEELLLLLLLLLEAAYFAELEALLLDALSEAALCEALLLLADFAACEALAELELEAELADFEAFAARLAFEAESLADVELAVPLEVPDAVLDAL
jgi:hypothetical protein